jgi:hypothetical protein
MESMENTQERPGKASDGQNTQVDWLSKFMATTGRAPDKRDVENLRRIVPSTIGNACDFQGALVNMAEANGLSPNQVSEVLDSYAQNENKAREQIEAEQREKQEKKKAFRRSAGRAAKWGLAALLAIATVGAGIGAGVASYRASYDPLVRSKVAKVEKAGAEKLDELGRKQLELGALRDGMYEKFYGKLESLASVKPTTLSIRERNMYTDAKMSANHGFNSILYEGKIFYDGKVGDARVVGKIVNSVVKDNLATHVYPRLVIIKYDKEGGISRVDMYDRISDSSSIDQALKEAKPELVMEFDGEAATFTDFYAGIVQRLDGKGVFNGGGEALNNVSGGSWAVKNEFSTLYARGPGSVQQVAPDKSSEK